MDWLAASADVMRSRMQQPPPRLPAAEVEARTTLGAVIGLQPEGGTRCVFRGIPFAKAARFRAPVQLEPWAEPIRCRRSGKRCPQPAPVLNKPKDVVRRRQLVGLAKRLPSGMSEDCLYLDVYTPALDARKPVICWIHGGAFIAGSGSGPVYASYGTPGGYTGSLLSDRADVVLVTVNYRLGAFGFLKLPGGDANCGLRDQVAALKWIAQEISNFGGDPANVTIMGQSAGGMSCGALIASPAAQDLFHKAVVMSGSLENVMSESDAHIITETLAKRLGIEPTLEAFEAVPSTELMRAQMKLMGPPPRGVGLMPFQPHVDGSFLPDVPLDIIRQRSVDSHRYLVGYTSDEWRLFHPATSLPIVGTWIGQRRSLEDAAGAVQRFLEAIQVPMVTKEDARALLKTIRSDFHCPHWGAAFDMFISLVAFAAPAARALRALSAAAPDGTFAYIFDFSGGLLGPAHAMELPLLFGTYDANPILKWVSGAPNGGERVSADLMNAFGAFAHSGSPSVSGMDWLPYSEAQATTARFGDEPSIHQAGINASLASVIELMEGHTRPFGLNMPVQFDAELAEPRSKL